MPFTYRYPHPAVSVDCVVLRPDGGELKILLIRRGSEPFAGNWALPGGFVEIDEPLDQAALRELEEETGLVPSRLEQIGAFGDPDRDPRERVISIAYLAQVATGNCDAKAADDAVDARWFAVSRLPALAFDHDKIIAAALARASR
jgi:8-oxo-dGTP diphosphatase